MDQGTEASGEGAEGGLEGGEIGGKIGLDQGFELVPAGVPTAELEIGTECVHFGAVGVGGLGDTPGQAEDFAGLGTHAGLPVG